MGNSFVLTASQNVLRGLKEMQRNPFSFPIYLLKRKINFSFLILNEVTSDCNIRELEKSLNFDKS